MSNFVFLAMGIFYIPLIGISIFCMVLYIKLALRGIKALDIYIEKNK